MKGFLQNRNFLNFEFRVVDGNSRESLALVITVGVVAVLSITTLSLALLSLIRTNREDGREEGKSQMVTSTTDGNML